VQLPALLVAHSFLCEAGQANTKHFEHNFGVKNGGISFGSCSNVQTAQQKRTIADVRRHTDEPLRTLCMHSSDGRRCSTWKCYVECYALYVLRDLIFENIHQMHQ